MRKNRLLLNFLLIPSLFIFAVSCGEEEGGVVKAESLAASVKQTDAKLTELLSKDGFADRFQELENRNQNLEERNKTLQDKIDYISNNEAIKEVQTEIEYITTKIEKDLVNLEPYKELHPTATQSNNASSQSVADQQKDIANLSAAKDNLSAHIYPNPSNPTVLVSTEGKDNSTDSSSERITVGIKDENGSGKVKTQDVYNGKGVLLETTDYVIGADKHYHKFVTTYDENTGIIKSDVEFDDQGKRLFKVEYDENGIITKRIEFDSNDKEKATIYSQLDAIAVARGKSCISGGCVRLSVTEKKNESNIPEDKRSYSQDLYVLMGGSIGEVAKKEDAEGYEKYTPTKCYDSVNNVYLLEQVIQINDLNLMQGKNPIEYYISAFNDDCSQLRCQVQYSKEHTEEEFKYIDPNTCCDSRYGTDCTDKLLASTN